MYLFIIKNEQEGSRNYANCYLNSYLFLKYLQIHQQCPTPKTLSTYVYKFSPSD